MLKELGAKWLVEMAEYFADNPKIIVNGFVRAGITAALDGHADVQEEQNDENTDSDDYESEYEDNEIVDLVSED